MTIPLYIITSLFQLFHCSPEYYMVGNDIVGIDQVSLLVVFRLLSRCRSSGHQGKNGNYGVSGSGQQGDKWKLWCFRPLLCILIIFARVQHSDRGSYRKFILIIIPHMSFNVIYSLAGQPTHSITFIKIKYRHEWKTSYWRYLCNFSLRDISRKKIPII